MHFAVISLIGVVIWRLLKGGGVTNAQMSNFAEGSLRAVTEAVVRFLIIFTVVTAAVAVVVLWFQFRSVLPPWAIPIAMVYGVFALIIYYIRRRVSR